MFHVPFAFINCWNFRYLQAKLLNVLVFLWGKKVRTLIFLQPTHELVLPRLCINMSKNMSKNLQGEKTKLFQHLACRNMLGFMANV